MAWASVQVALDSRFNHLLSLLQGTTKLHLLEHQKLNAITLGCKQKRGRQWTCNNQTTQQKAGYS